MFTPHSTMKDVIATLPYAKVLLQKHFHLGGCQKCGYEPHQTIEDVASHHQKESLDILMLLNTFLSHQSQIEIDPEELRSLINSSASRLCLIDVREPWEQKIAQIPGSEVLDEGRFSAVLDRAKECAYVVVYCHHGIRSRQAALFLREHGISGAVSLRGGIDQFATQVAPDLARY